MAPTNIRVGLIVTRVRDFTRMNLLEIFSSKVEEYRQEFIDEVHEIVEIIGITVTTGV